MSGSTGNPPIKRSDQRKRRWAIAVVVLLIVAYSVYFSAYTLRRHQAHLTAGFDLGNVDQALWSTLHGRLLGNTTTPGITTRLGLHFEPVLLLLTPFYLIRAAPETLMVLQSTIVALGALPIFLLVRDELGEWPAVGFVAAYLLFPALEAANSFDFHALTLSPTFLGWALWSMRKRRYWLFGLSAALAMGCKEEIPLVVAMMGALTLLLNRDFWPGIVTVAFAFAWFAVANLLIIPAFSPSGANIHYERYPELGHSLGEMLNTLITRPWLPLGLLFEGDRAFTLLRLTMPVGFLALGDPLTLALVVPSVAINLFSSYRPMHSLDVYHYWAPVVPFVVCAAATGARRLADLAWRFLKVRRRFVIGLLAVMVMVVSFSYHRALGYTPLRRGFVWPEVTVHHRRLDELVEMIPPGAAVSAQNPLVPHVSQRHELTVFPRIDGAEYVLLDQTAPVGANVVEDWLAYDNAVQELHSDRRYRLLMEKDGYLLFQLKLSVE